MQPGSNPARKMKRTTDSRRSDGIQLVRIINQTVNQSLRPILAAVTVTAHRIGDFSDQRFIHTAGAAEKIRRFPVTRLRVTDSAAGLQFFRTRHIMQQCRKRHCEKRSFIRWIQLLPGKHPGIPQHPFRVIEIMTSRRTAQLFPNSLPNPSIQFVFHKIQRSRQ